MENVIFSMQPYRLIQWIVVWYCICHLTIVILLNGVKFILRWLRPAWKKKGESVKS